MISFQLADWSFQKSKTDRRLDLTITIKSKSLRWMKIWVWFSKESISVIQSDGKWLLSRQTAAIADLDCLKRKFFSYIFYFYIFYPLYYVLIKQSNEVRLFYALRFNSHITMTWACWISSDAYSE